MVKIISFFIRILNIINKLSFKLECFLLQFINDVPSTITNSEAYRKFKIDPLPITKPEHLPISFGEAKKRYEVKHLKPLTPVKRRNNSSIDSSIYCPHCGATHHYIYDNTGKGIHFRCKVCEHTFSTNKSYTQQISHFCPYCGCKLDLRKKREHYLVYRCPNDKCSLYKHNLKSLSNEQKTEYKSNPYKFKLRYITRIFDASLEQLEKLQSVIKPSTVDLSRIRRSKHILGLILTYHINYGLSLRKTALIMREVHDVNVSHQTVANYAEAASHLLDPWLQNYQYDLSHMHCGDETYVSIKKKKAYVFFMCDSIKKIITSYNIFLQRDTFSAIQTFYSVFRKGKLVSKYFRVVVDGNPIYQAAHQYFHHRGIHFTLLPVIGLKNKDELAKRFRAPKQIIERLNRTFKYSYYVKNGFKSLAKANEFMCLFTTYFNFLRNHMSLGYKPPVELESLQGITNMPAKWQILLDMAHTYLIETELPFD